MSKQIEFIVFDIGGVLVELMGMPTMLQWTDNQLTADELWAKWLSSPSVRSFELGRSTPERFANDVIEEMNLPVKRDEFLKAFTRWPKGLYPGTTEILKSLQGRYHLATMSNTNALHWPILTEEMGLGPMFDQHFASHITGKLKPDRESFEHLVQSLKCEASNILFLDDNEINAAGARSVGMIAHRAQGMSQAKKILEGLGILKGD